MSHDLSADTVVELHKFQPRWYQRELIDAIENKGYKRALCVLPRRCLSGESHITMADGSFKFLKDIVEGDRILSWDGEQFVADKVKHAWKTESKKTKRVRAGHTLPIIASNDHVFAHASQSKDYIKWSPMQEIGKNRNLVLYKGMKDIGDTRDDLAEFWGYMLADGYVSAYQQPKFSNVNETILNRVASLATQLFDINIIWRKKGNGYDLGMSNGTKGGGYTKNPVKELFRNEGLDRPKSQCRLPSMVWKLCYSSIYSFISGIISADGGIYIQKASTINNNPIRSTVAITINCGFSYYYAWDMYWLLRKIGVMPHVPYAEKTSNWKIKFGKSEDVFRVLSNLHIWGKEEKQEEALRVLRNYYSDNNIKHNDQLHFSRFKSQDEGEEELYDIETSKNHNFFANGYLVHNSGKDITAFNLAIRECLRKTCTVAYILPTYAQAKKVIWDAIDNDGFRVLDYIPQQVIASKNSQEMKIWFKNGSLLCLLGSDNYDSLVGSNFHACIFSEYALQDPKAYQYLRPILTVNDGWAVFLSTPRSRNHLWYMYQIAKESPDWFCQRLTVNDTKHISHVAIERERAEGIMSDDMINQEYYCSWDQGAEGAYYSKYYDKLQAKEQITHVPHEPSHKVHTAWDLGYSDSTVIIFFQVIGNIINVIEVYENNKEPLEHYIQYLQSKPYIYGTHIAPHDLKVREFTSGMSRLEKARQLGVEFSIAPNMSIMDGIEAVRSTLPKMWIDKDNASKLVDALQNYRAEYDSRRHVYKDRPLHDRFSHVADALRYLCLMVPKIGDGMTAEELEQQYQEAISGDKHRLPPMFRGY